MYKYARDASQTSRHDYHDCEACPPQIVRAVHERLPGQDEIGGCGKEDRQEEHQGDEGYYGE